MEEDGSGACTFSRSPNELCIYANERHGDGEVTGHAPRVTSAGPSSPDESERKIKYTHASSQHDGCTLYTFRIARQQQFCNASPESLSLYKPGLFLTQIARLDQ
jgi:hypothetical protein